MSNKYMKGCSISLVINKLQIKTTIKYHYKPIEITRYRETGTLTHYWWECKTGPPF